MVSTEISPPVSGAEKPTPETQKAARRPRTRLLIIAGGALLLILAGSFAWDTLYGPTSRRIAGDRELEKNLTLYQTYVQNYEDAMRADTDGGKTPEETLQLFIQALKAGDVDLASRYFMLETNESDPDYLTRKKWEEALQQSKKEEKLNSIADLLSRAVVDRDGIAYETDYKFSVFNEKAEMEAYINMEFNKYSNVWKIESM